MYSSAIAVSADGILRSCLAQGAWLRQSAESGTHKELTEVHVWSTANRVLYCPHESRERATEQHARIYGDIPLKVSPSLDRPKARVHVCLRQWRENPGA